MKIGFSMLFVLVFLGCNRKEFKLYEGQYKCKVFTAEEEPGKPTVYTIDEGEQVVALKEDRKFIKVFDETVHIDDIEPNVVSFWESDGKSHDLLFRNDSMFYSVKYEKDNKSITEKYIGVKE